MTKNTYPRTSRRLTRRDWCAIPAEVMHAIKRAWDIRHSKGRVNVELPHLKKDCYLSDKDIKRITVMIDLLILLLLFWKPGRCFYRSYAMASVLRARGVNLLLNLGCLHFINQKQRAYAHCWLTLNGDLFAERKDPYKRFPVLIGSHDKQVQYWFNAHEGDEIKKEKKYRSSV